MDDALQPTPNACSLPRRFSDFATFPEALQYAACGERGLNFHDSRGNLTRVYPFAELYADAQAAARRLVGAGLRNQRDSVAFARPAPDQAPSGCLRIGV
jgi:fatty-acyl-CoA synthase